MIPENKKTKNILFKTCKNLKKIPMTRWFYFFHAVSNATGEKFPFFIEMYIVNFSKCKTSMTFSTRNEKLSEAQMSMEEASLFCSPVQQVSKQKKKSSRQKNTTCIYCRTSRKIWNRRNCQMREQLFFCTGF